MQQGDLSLNKKKRYRVDSNCPNAAIVYKAKICLSATVCLAKLKARARHFLFRLGKN